MFGKNSGEGGSSDDRSGDSDKNSSMDSKAETDSEEGPTKDLRIGPAAGGGLREDVDYGGGPAAQSCGIAEGQEALQG